jgi:hypothetical protein
MEPAHVRGFLRARILAILPALLLCSLVVHSSAFSLLGPYADWMQVTNNFRMPGDIGGPMDITEGYRWNAPMLTYGFDQSFLNFFGDQGVTAVESAIQILNDLPPASEIVLTNYPFTTLRKNWPAEAAFLVDLKSAALCALVEHMGLAQPDRNVFILRRWAWFIPNETDEMFWPPGTIPDFIAERNFDPQTHAATHWMDQILYSGIYFRENDREFIQTFSIDPTDPYAPSVAQGFSQFEPFGSYFTGLTYDDVGGTRFLLSRTNVNYETLLPDVQSANPNHAIVNGAWRPGVEKITFVRHDYDTKSGQPVPMTFRYKDAYLTNGVLMRQNVKRVVMEPDFLFSAGDMGSVPHLPLYSRSGTSNWINNATLNGHPDAAGPGLITPPVRIIFQKLGPEFLTETPDPADTWSFPLGWGSFQGSTNPPTSYPLGMAAATTNVTVWFQMYGPSGVAPYGWHVPASPGALVQLQTSTNLATWATQAVFTNNGTVVDWQQYGTQLPRQFFRAVAQ